MSSGAHGGGETLSVSTQMHRRTVLVAVSGELDIATRPQMADVLDRVKPTPDTVRHVVLDLRGVSFMDGQGLHELARQAEFARENHHNFVVVRGRGNVRRLLEMSADAELLVLVDDPEDLVPPSAADQPVRSHHRS